MFNFRKEQLKMKKKKISGVVVVFMLFFLSWHLQWLNNCRAVRLDGLFCSCLHKVLWPFCGQDGL